MAEKTKRGGRRVSESVNGRTFGSPEEFGLEPLAPAEIEEAERNLKAFQAERQQAYLDGRTTEASPKFDE